MALPPDRIAYAPIIDRPVISWPNEARVALWVSPNIEYYEYLPPISKFRNHWPRSPHPDAQQYASRDYGNRVGFWRMLEVLDKHDIRCTVSLNEAVLEHFAEIREAMLARNWEYMSHGIYNTRNLYGMTEEEEREFYRDCIETLKKYTGKQLKGMLGPGLSNTERTPDLMAEAGLVYHADWFIDDQPLPIKVKEGRLISVPYTIELNDVLVLGLLSPLGGEAFAQAIKDQFDRLYAEGAQSGRVMCISLHPYLIGLPHIIRYLDEALAYILSHDGVWKTTAEDIAEYYFAHYYDTMVAFLEQ